MTTLNRNANRAARAYEINRLNIERLIGELRRAEKAILCGIRSAEGADCALELLQPQVPSEARLMQNRLQNIRVTIARLSTQLAYTGEDARI